MMKLEDEAKVLIPPLAQFSFAQRGEFFSAQMNNASARRV
jgi:hypothetical protein